MKTKVMLFVGAMVLGSVCVFAPGSAALETAATMNRPNKPTQTLTWKEAAPGVWSIQIGEREDYTLLNAAGSQPKIEALQKLPPVKFPLDHQEIRFERRKGKTYLRFPLGDGEEIYGLGLDFNKIRQNKTVQTLHVDAWSGKSGRTHAPVPFYVSNRGYGILINSARYLEIYIGTGVRVDSKNPPVVYDRNNQKREWQSVPKSDNIEILVPADGVEVLAFAGPTPLNAVQRFNLYSGGGSLPPKWGLGFTHRTPTLYTHEQVKQEAAEFEKRGFPLDFIGLEPGWHDFAYPCSFEWDKTRFPDPKGLIDELYAKGVRVNLWYNPYVAPSAPLYQKLLPYAGSHTVWNGIVPDYSMPEARRVFADHLREKQVSLGPGIGGFKMDEVDGHDHWLWPDVATFPSGHDAEQLRQTYGLLQQRLTFELFRQQNRRTYGLVRGSNAGSAPFPYALYSDSYSYEGYITALCNSGFSGILWTPEVRSAKTPEEWVRRIQTVCFSPMAMLNAWASGTKPWTFPEAAEPVREAMLLRMRLLPYLYSTFAQYHFEGTPPIRPMPLVPGFAFEARTEKGKLDDTSNPYEEARTREIKDQFMLGDSLLVAPMPFDKTSRTVVLPQGKWFDFYTGALVGESQVITVSPGLDRMPLFVRDGGIIPLIPARLHAPKAGEVAPLEVRHYGAAPGAFRLYDDDGGSFDYEKGAYSWTRLNAQKNADGQWHGEVIKEKPSAVFHYGPVTWKFMSR